MRSLIATICILGLVGMVVGVAVNAVDTATVTATVTVQNISVGVTDATVAYGVLAAGASRNTMLYNAGTNPDGMSPADTQTATNNGNIIETLNIRGTNSAAWTLAATSSGAIDYQHAFSTNSFATSSALTTSNQTLATGVATSTAKTFDLKVTTPPSAANFEQQSVNVIVQATI